MPKQATAAFRQHVLVRIDGAGHLLIEYLITLSTKRKALLFTCGRMITVSDETAIMALSDDAWEPASGRTAPPGTTRTPPRSRT